MWEEVVSNVHRIYVNRYNPLPMKDRVYKRTESLEIKDDPMSYVSFVERSEGLDCNENYGEVEGGKDIMPDWNHPESSR